MTTGRNAELTEKLKAADLVLSQTSVPITTSNGYGENEVSVSRGGYRCLGVVGYMINNTYYAMYSEYFSESTEMLKCGIRKYNSSGSDDVTVYAKCLYVKIGS